jgi:hypothetical protein
MGAADDGRACRAQAGNGRGVCAGEGRILQHQGAGGAARALRVEQVLDRDGQAGQGVVDGVSAAAQRASSKKSG